MTQPPISALHAVHNQPAQNDDSPLRAMLLRTLGPDVDTLTPDLLSRIAHLVDRNAQRNPPDNSGKTPSRMLHHLRTMRRADSPGGGSWTEIKGLSAAETNRLSHLDRRITGLHSVLTILHAAEFGRTHDDGISELGDDLSIGLLFAARELVNGAQESMSQLQALWREEATLGTA